LPEAELPSLGCGEQRHGIGEQIGEQLEFVPASLHVIEHVRFNYACRSCLEHVATSAKLAQPIDRGFPTPGLLAHTITSEYSNQYSLDMPQVENEARFITDSLDGIQALIYNDECVGLQLPVVVELKVTQCDPGVRGNSATGRTKPATLETGLVVHVPEYLGQGEMVKIDTRTGEFLSRV
jgi:hypothetical protein